MLMMIMMYVKHAGKIITVKHVGIGMKVIGVKVTMIAGETFAGIMKTILKYVMFAIQRMIAISVCMKMMLRRHVKNLIIDGRNY